MGALVGYNGSFSFKEIGMEYVDTPYVLMRAMPALFGAAVIPVMTANNSGRIRNNEELWIFRDDLFISCIDGISREWPGLPVEAYSSRFIPSVLYCLDSAHVDGVPEV
jgi:Dolichyl-phosphate-mannose-protein mannosyltransferase